MNQRFHPKNIRLGATGAKKVLGDLESAVMNCIWKKNEASVRNVRDELAKNGRELSFNAIMTIMNRLVEKNILTKKKKGKVYVYHAEVSQEDFFASIATDAIDSIFNDQLLFSAAHFAEVSQKLDPKTIKKLKEFIQSSESSS